MWVPYFFVGYLVLALAIPLGWVLVPVWRKAGVSRCVKCPEASKSVTVRLDRWYAVRMCARGDRGLRVHECTEWPQRRDCGQACLVQIAAEM